MNMKYDEHETTTGGVSTFRHDNIRKPLQTELGSLRGEGARWVTFA
ncbi:MAG: hypothetical protein H0X43_08125 [Nitrosospira sp.]|nr:hypothetical protein [Nitrosospira sp.]